MSNPWIPSLFVKRTDGGSKSGVTAYFLIEWKKVFSIAILKFEPGSREAYHSHAFHAITWWIKGKVTEVLYPHGTREFKASIKPKLTPRKLTHRVVAHVNSYALTFRGPWKDQWTEIREGKLVTLTHGRIEI